MCSAYTESLYYRCVAFTLLHYITDECCLHCVILLLMCIVPFVTLLGTSQLRKKCRLSFNRTYLVVFNVAKKLNSVTFAAFITSLIKRMLFKLRITLMGSMLWSVCLRHCSWSSMVAGSFGILHWHNPSGRYMALRPAQPLTEMSSTRNISWGKGGRCIGLTLTPSCTDCLEIWQPQHPGTRRACPGLYRGCFNFYYINDLGVIVSLEGCKLQIFGNILNKSKFYLGRN